MMAVCEPVGRDPSGCGGAATSTRAERGRSPSARAGLEPADASCALRGGRA
jgi:hypothetical protein